MTSWCSATIANDNPAGGVEVDHGSIMGRQSGCRPQVVDLTYHLTPLEIEILTIVAHDMMV